MLQPPKEGEFSCQWCQSTKEYVISKDRIICAGCGRKKEPNKDEQRNNIRIDWK